MEIAKNNPLAADIREVLQKSKLVPTYELRCKIHSEKEDLFVIKLISLDIVKDYANKISDYIYLEVMMGLGDYSHRLYPNRANLEVSIKKIRLNNTSGKKEPDVIERFKAIFLDNENEPVTSSKLNTRQIEELNIHNVVNVKLQLMSRSVEPLRIKTCSGSYNNITQSKLLNSILSVESSKVLVDGKVSIDAVDVVEPDNKKIIEQVIIKSGTHVLDLPTYLQEKCMGVYNCGLGTYIQTYKNKKTWYVYPLYNVNLFDKSKSKIIFYVVPNVKYTGLDRSYCVDADIIKAIVSSEHTYTDSIDVNQMSDGSGFRMSDAKAFMKKPVDITEDGVVGNRGRLNYEAISSPRKDGLNYAKQSTNRISSNPFTEFSKLNAQSLARVDIKWENADSDLIYPGMPCKYVFVDSESKIVELKGIILFCHSFRGLRGTGVVNSDYTTKCDITILCESMKKVTDKPQKNKEQKFLNQSYGKF